MSEVHENGAKRSVLRGIARFVALFRMRDFIQANVETTVKAKGRAKQKSYPRRN
jgi:hypothetical protein